MRRAMIGIGSALLLAATIAACSVSPSVETGATGGAARAVAGPQVTPAPANAEREPVPAPVQAPAGVVFQPEYVIRNGDDLGIKFFFNPELDEEITVRPDGRISLLLVPEVVAAGRTPSELTQELKSLYARELDSPEISVIVRTFSAHRVYVDGEVGRPGELELSEGLTAMQAIARAQGFTDRARKGQVMIIRRGEGGRPVVSALSVYTARKGRVPDVTLAPYDIVFVPKTRITSVNKWVEQYIRSNIPISFGFRLDIDRD